MFATKIKIKNIKIKQHNVKKSLNKQKSTKKNVSRRPIRASIRNGKMNASRFINNNNNIKYNKSVNKLNINSFNKKFGKINLSMNNNKISKNYINLRKPSFPSSASKLLRFNKQNANKLLNKSLIDLKNVKFNNIKLKNLNMNGIKKVNLNMNGIKMVNYGGYGGGQGGYGGGQGGYGGGQGGFGGQQRRQRNWQPPSRHRDEDVYAAIHDHSDDSKVDKELLKITNNVNELPQELVNHLTRQMGIENFFPVQHFLYKPIVDGKDVVVKSRTGTGKTLAFCLPLIQKTLTTNSRAAPGSCTTLILEPTRELCTQVVSEIRKISKGIQVGEIMGGVPYARQEQRLRGGLDFVVATPGRLIDHLQRGTMHMESVKTVVFDESDEMLKMGFKKEIDEVLNLAPASKQVLCFSATLPSWLNDNVVKSCKDPEQYNFVGDAVKTSETLTHFAVPMTPGAELDTIIKRIINRFSSKKTLVFCETKTGCNELGYAMGSKASVIHGDCNQSQRQNELNQFKSGRKQIMVATDVASRGIDIPDVDLVISTFFPSDADGYVHRSGRAGRAGKVGQSVILYNTRDSSINFPKLERTLGTKILQGSIETQQTREDLIKRTIGILNKKAVLTPKMQYLVAKVAPILLKKAQPEEIVSRLVGLLLQDEIEAERSLLSNTEAFTTFKVKQVGSAARQLCEGMKIRELTNYDQENCSFVDISDEHYPEVLKMEEFEEVQKLPEDFLRELTVKKSQSYGGNRSYGNQGGYNRGGNQGGYNNRGGNQGGYNNRGGNQGGYNNRGGNQGGYNNRGGSQGGYGGGQGGYNNRGGSQGGYGGGQGGYNKGGSQGGQKSPYSGVW